MTEFMIQEWHDVSLIITCLKCKSKYSIEQVYLTFVPVFKEDRFFCFEVILIDRDGNPYNVDLLICGGAEKYCSVFGKVEGAVFALPCIEHVAGPAWVSHPDSRDSHLAVRAA